VRVAFDSRPTAESRGAGCYARCLLQALRDTAGEEDEIFETHRPRRAEVFHSPWMQGAMLHSPCPMVVTLNDLTALKRPSERLRGGGMHLHLRHLALQRATHVIVPSEDVAGEAAAELGLELERVIVIPQASDLITQGSDLTAQGSNLAAQGSDLTAPTAHRQPAQPMWTWEDAARETWAVYRRALAQPHRPCVAKSRRLQHLRLPRSGRAIFDRSDRVRGLQ
jgi:hypothetical protein